MPRKNPNALPPLSQRPEHVRTRAQICEQFAVSADMTYRWQREGLVTAYRMGNGNSVRFDLMEVAALLAPTPSKIRNQHSPAKSQQVA